MCLYLLFVTTEKGNKNNEIMLTAEYRRLCRAEAYADNGNTKKNERIERWMETQKKLD